MRHARLGANDTWFWPVVADSFIGILAVFVFLTWTREPPDKELITFKESLRTRLVAEEQAKLVEDFKIRTSEVRIIFTAESLSFEPCQWTLPEEKGRRIRGLLMSFADRPDLVDEIRIEGHADRRAVSTCRDLGPFRDNLQLSQNRARAVFDAIVGLGDSAHAQAGVTDNLREADPRSDFLKRLYADGKIQMAGYGHTRPMNQENPEDPLNRRVEIVVMFRDSPKRVAGTQ